MFWLIWQMGLILLAAFALGLFFGRQIWSGDARSAEADQALAEASRLRAENENLARRLGESEARQKDVSPNVQPVPAQSAPAPAKAEADTGAVNADEQEPDPAAETPTPKVVKPTPSAKRGKTAAKPAKADAPADDLTKIKGLGPKAAAALHDGGVTRFAQIAAWSDTDVEDWDALINGRGRITRDDWVGQARSLVG
ncbi:hypothetical protein [Maricaulis sp. MIT060901]|uniref:hypothetical protein n=1 Tax=Maricaulis sp. MIT060901 TaxID=3096993 RepID=UPI00399C147A